MRFHSAFNGHRVYNPFLNLEPSLRHMFEPQESAASAKAAPVLLPACDISESESHFFLTLDVPGVQLEDIKIEVKGDQLAIEAARKTPGEAKATRHLSERSFGVYSRRFSLGEGVDQENIEAALKDGVLRIALAKAKAVKPKTIKIVSGDSARAHAEPVSHEI